MNPLSEPSADVRTLARKQNFVLEWLQHVHTNMKMREKGITNSSCPRVAQIAGDVAGNRRSASFRAPDAGNPRFGSCPALSLRAGRSAFRVEHRDREMELRALADFAFHP